MCIDSGHCPREHYEEVKNGQPYKVDQHNKSIMKISIPYLPRIIFFLRQALIEFINLLAYIAVGHEAL